LIFLILAIVGYFTVPSVANYIINAGSMGGHLSKTTSMAAGATTQAVQTAMAARAAELGL